jgi:hypothetical protein
MFSSAHFTRSAKGRLVVAIKIGQMNFEPPKALNTQRLTLRKNEQRTAQVIANVVQMWRNGVCTAAEVQVVGHVDSIAQELEKKKMLALVR